MYKCYSVTHVAEMLDVTKQIVYQWIKDGKLETVKVAGHTTRITQSSLDRFFDMSFNWLKFKEGKVLVHCLKKEQAEKFCKMMHDRGLTWCDGTSYLETTDWDSYGRLTCYLGDGTIESLANPTNGKEVVSFYDAERGM